MKHIILLFSIIYSQFFISQNNPGLFGKKNVIDLNFTASTPLLQRLFNFGETRLYYVYKDNGLQQKRDIIDIAYAFSYSRSISQKTSFGIELSYQKIDTKTNVNYTLKTNPDYIYYEGAVENFKFNHVSIIPRFEFTSQNGIFGIGVNNQLGFGVGLTSFIDKVYETELYDEYYNSALLSAAQKQGFQNKLYDFSKNKFRNFVILYALNFRQALAKNLMLNYGFRYTLNLLSKNTSTVMINNNYFLQHDNISQILNREKMTNIVQFKLGLAYVF
jgi:hypothetical protein